MRISLTASPSKLRQFLLRDCPAITECLYERHHIRTKLLNQYGKNYRLPRPPSLGMKIFQPKSRNTLTSLGWARIRLTGRSTKDMANQGLKDHQEKYAPEKIGH
jgi:hypothetical protein